MKDSFPGYYPLSNDQMKAFLSDAIIVFDVNALLDLFRIEENQAKTVLKVGSSQILVQSPNFYMKEQYF